MVGYWSDKAIDHDDACLLYTSDAADDLIGVDRTVRRRENGGVVAVALRDRPFVAVLGDMIEGVIVVNRLVAPVADQVRTALWAILSIRGFISTDFTTATSATMRSDQTQTRVA